MTDTKKPRKELKRISDKRLAQLGGKAFSTIQPSHDAKPKRKPASAKAGTRAGMMRRKSGTKRKPRSPEEFARIYGSKARVEFVKRLPCAACGYDRDRCENHHIRGDGVSRKADYTTIIPLCALCHDLWHDKGRSYVAQRFGLDPEHAARTTENAWLAARSQGGDSR